MTSVLDQLASASGQAKQDLNIALAQNLVKKKNTDGINELVSGLTHKTKSIRHDCIKTLYEVAALQPELLKPHVAVFISLLDDKDNRMQWGSMTALSAITPLASEQVFNALHKIMNTAGNGSVITKDHCVRILTLLSANKKYRDTTLPLLLDQLLQAPVNQAPAYAEQTLPVITALYKSQFEKILLTRLNDTEQESKRKRLEKILKKLR